MKIPDAPVVELTIGGEKRSFDLDEPQLPDWVKKEAFASGGYPYAKKMDEEEYGAQLEKLQAELVKLMYHLQETGGRLLMLFEGRDAAGKGGSISTFRENLNPRHVRGVALSKPSDTEAGQWYFQRYAQHLPTRGEMVLFDRSWYNRAGVEPVMGFCTPQQYEKFLHEAPKFEQILVHEGISLFKFWLSIGQEMQLKRFHDRRHDPCKVWKLSPIDIKALQKWDDYSTARDRMLKETHTKDSPWTVILANDKRRARLAVMRCVLGSLDYDCKDRAVVGEPDTRIVIPGDRFVGGEA
jgi:polyphosphate kinase 2